MICTKSLWDPYSLQCRKLTQRELLSSHEIYDKWITKSLVRLLLQFFGRTNPLNYSEKNNVTDSVLVKEKSIFFTCPILSPFVQYCLWHTSWPICDRFYLWSGNNIWFSHRNIVRINEINHLKCFGLHWWWVLYFKALLFTSQVTCHHS